MATIPDEFTDVVRRSVTSLQGTAARLSEEYKIAKKRYEDGLAAAIETFDLLNEADEFWRVCVYRKIFDYDPEPSRIIKEQYAAWQTTARQLMEWLTIFQNDEVQYVDELASRLREVDGILTDDADFFRDDALIELRDQAIEEHRRGDSVEYGAT